MRVAACYRADRYMRPSAARDPVERARIGWAGVDSSEVLGLEDPIGDGPPVTVRQHPEMLIASEPELWPVIDRWRLGLRRVSARERALGSHWEIEALMTMRGAHHRERAREIERAKERHA